MSTLANVELVMWAQQGEPPTVSEVRAALEAKSFNREHAEDIPAATGFRRSVKMMETSDPLTRATCWRRDGSTHAQLDVLNIDEVTARMRREYVSAWSLREDGTVHGSTPLDISAQLSRYTWADVSVIIRRVLEKEGLGSYTPRRSGGVYFVPVASKSTLDRLEAFCESLGLNLLRYQVPDTDAHRAEIADAIVASFEAEIVNHATAIADYAVDKTAAGVVRNRGDAIEGTLFLINRMGPHMSGRIEPLVQRCGQLAEQCRVLAQQITAHKPAAKSGRRIMTGAAN